MAMLNNQGVDTSGYGGSGCEVLKISRNGPLSPSPWQLTSGISPSPNQTGGFGGLSCFQLAKIFGSLWGP